jgi:hypothetical protein
MGWVDQAIKITWHECAGDKVCDRFPGAQPSVTKGLSERNVVIPTNADSGLRATASFAGSALAKSLLPQSGFFPLGLCAHARPTTPHDKLELRRREQIPIPEFLRSLEQEIGPQLPPGNGEPRILEPIPGISRPSGRRQTRTAAKEVNLRSKICIGHLALGKPAGQPRRAGTHRLAQLRPGGKPLQLVKPVAQVSAKVLKRG